MFRGGDALLLVHRFIPSGAPAPQAPGMKASCSAPTQIDLMPRCGMAISLRKLPSKASATSSTSLTPPISALLAQKFSESSLLICLVTISSVFGSARVPPARFSNHSASYCGFGGTLHQRFDRKPPSHLISWIRITNSRCKES